MPQARFKPTEARIWLYALPPSHHGWVRWTLIFIVKCKRFFHLFPSLGQVFPLRDLMDKKCEFAPGSCACAHLVTLQQARTFKENYTLNCPFKNRFSCLPCKVKTIKLFLYYWSILRAGHKTASSPLLVHVRDISIFRDRENLIRREGMDGRVPRKMCQSFSPYRELLSEYKRLASLNLCGTYQGEQDI